MNGNGKKLWNFYVESDLLRAVKRLAKANGNTTAEEMRVALRSHVKRSKGKVAA